MINWNRLPSLPALRAFEAANTAGSYSEAARSLNVTHAAIAQHIRTLEKHFAMPLMTRAGQGMTPTPEGALLAAALAEGFAAIADGCNRLHDLTSERPLSISCTPSFAENWLMPRMAQFWAEHPDIDVTIMPSTRIVHFRADRVDCAIRYGSGDWTDASAQPLLTGDFIVTCAPSLAPKTPITDVRQLQDQIWMMDDTRSEQHIISRDLGMDPNLTDVRTFATNGMVLAAARSGLGFAVQSRALAARDLEDGKLVEVFSLRSPNLGYWIVHPEGTDFGRLRKFIRWLKVQVAANTPPR